MSQELRQSPIVDEKGVAKRQMSQEPWQNPNFYVLVEIVAKRQMSQGQRQNPNIDGLVEMVTKRQMSQ